MKGEEDKDKCIKRKTDGSVGWLVGWLVFWPVEASWVIFCRSQFNNYGVRFCPVHKFIFIIILNREKLQRKAHSKQLKPP